MQRWGDSTKRLAGGSWGEGMERRATILTRTRVQLALNWISVRRRDSEGVCARERPLPVRLWQCCKVCRSISWLERQSSSLPQFPHIRVQGATHPRMRLQRLEPIILVKRLRRQKTHTKALQAGSPPCVLRPPYLYSIACACCTPGAGAAVTNSPTSGCVA